MLKACNSPHSLILVPMQGLKNKRGNAADPAWQSHHRRAENNGQRTSTTTAAHGASIAFTSPAALRFASGIFSLRVWIQRVCFFCVPIACLALKGTSRKRTMFGDIPML